MTFALRLQQAMDKADMDQSALARELRITSSSVNQWLKQGRVPRFERLQAIGAALSVDIYWLIAGRDPPGKAIEIPLVGYVSAGDEFEPFDDNPKGQGFEMIPVDFGETPICVEVRGDSMLDVYRAGDRLFGPQHVGKDIATYCVNRDCVVKTMSGEGFIKKLVRGSNAGLYTLRSYNNDYKDRIDVRLKWAAPVRWVRRMAA